MLSNQDLQALLSYQFNSPVLSIYLNTDPGKGNADIHRLYLRSMLKEIDLADDVAAVTRYIEHEHDWTGRSLAIFSCTRDGFFKAYPLAVEVKSMVRVSDRPLVKPLADLLDSYGGYGVVLVDKQGARLFSFHLGELQEQEGILGESIRHTKSGGGSQRQGQRGGSAGQTGYEDEVTDRNIKDAAEFSMNFFAEKNLRRILIGASDDNAAQFRNHLSKFWQSLIVGTFPISMTATHSEVLEKAMQIGLEAERMREIHLVNTVITNAAKGHGGVKDLDDTLAAVREGRVQMLVIQEGFHSPGTRCLNCGYLSAVELAYCPFCGGKSEVIPDVIEVAVEKVMQAGGEVEVLHLEKPIENFKQIGALVRY